MLGEGTPERRLDCAELIDARDLLAPDSPAVGDDDDDRRGEILEDGRRSWMFMTTEECLTVRGRRKCPGACDRGYFFGGRGVGLERWEGGWRMPERSEWECLNAVNGNAGKAAAANTPGGNN